MSSTFNLLTLTSHFSGDFSDMSFDDDGDGDGKLVIAEGDDLDIKMEGLGEDGKKEKKPRRKHNRFNGMSEEEVMKRLLPDLICPDLDILIVSISFAIFPSLKWESADWDGLQLSPHCRWGSTRVCTRRSSSTTMRALATTSVSSNSPSLTRVRNHRELIAPWAAASRYSDCPLSLSLSHSSSSFSPRLLTLLPLLFVICSSFHPLLLIAQPPYQTFKVVKLECCRFTRNSRKMPTVHLIEKVAR